MKKFTYILAALMFCLPVTASAQDYSSSAQTSQSSSADANDPSKMLPQEIQTRFENIRRDPDPDALVRDAHYWVSNENAHYVWYPYVKDLGGVLSGVGTDQVYLIAGWSNASLILPMDFDRMITNLHYAYGAAFLSANNIEEFRSYWKSDNPDLIKAALEKYFPDKAADAFKAWKHGVKEVNGRFNRVVKKYTKSEETEITSVPTFLTDETQYKRIKRLWENHRVFPICGDLTGNKAMIDIAKALRDSNMKMMILYPSNAEGYFEYTPEYRRNIVNMPFEDKSLILRTRQMRSLGLAEEEDYHYNMQSGENFQLWLKTTNIPDQHKMLRKRTKTAREGLSVLDYRPEPSKKLPKLADMPE